MKYILFAVFAIGAVDIAILSPLPEYGRPPVTADYGIPTVDPDCPPPGNQSESTYYPYYYDCSKYYECSDGRKVLMNCPDGLYWNITAHVCDYWYDVDCSYVWTSTGSPYTPTSGPEPAVDCTGVPDGTYFANPFDRTKFFECAGGVAIPFTCPAGKVFVDSTVICA